MYPSGDHTQPLIPTFCFSVSARTDGWILRLSGWEVKMIAYNRARFLKD